MNEQQYVDGFLLAVPEQNKASYQALAAKTAQIFKKNGALAVVECWGDDVPEGKLTSMPMAVKRGEGEQVVFSWIVWPSKEVRDTGMKACMEDPEMSMKDAPFDGKRMIYGGFRPILFV